MKVGIYNTRSAHAMCESPMAYRSGYPRLIRTTHQCEMVFIEDGSGLSYEDAAECGPLVVNPPVSVEFASGEPESYLYSWHNGGEFCPWMEFCLRPGLGNHDVAPHLAEFGMGMGIHVQDIAALPGEQLDSLLGFFESLRARRIRGEVALGLREDGAIISASVQHHLPMLAMYTYAMGLSTREIFRAFEGYLSPVPPTTRRTVIAVRVGYTHASRELRIPSDVRGCLWSTSRHAGILVARGANVKAARDDLFKSLRSVRGNDGKLMYRTDAGSKLKFILQRNEYHELTHAR